MVFFTPMCKPTVPKLGNKHRLIWLIDKIQKKNQKIIIQESYKSIKRKITEKQRRGVYFFTIQHCIFPSGKLTEKAVRRSVFLTIWHRILNADSIKTPVLLFSDFAGWVACFFNKKTFFLLTIKSC